MSFCVLSESKENKEKQQIVNDEDKKVIIYVLLPFLK